MEVSGFVGEEGVEDVGREIQDETVERREMYFSDWVGVRGGGGCGWDVGEGWRKGVRTGEVEPSIVGREDNGRWFVVPLIWFKVSFGSWEAFWSVSVGFAGAGLANFSMSGDLGYC